MYETITIEEAQAGLVELIGKLNPGEEVMITEDNQPVAKLTRQPASLGQPKTRRIGWLRISTRRWMISNLFEILPLTLEHGSEVSRLLFHHRDPFDRLMIAQSMWEQIPIVSADSAFDAYSIKTIW